MAWCEANAVGYIFGLAGNDVLHARVRAVADDLCVRRAEAREEKRRTWTEFRYAAKSWTAPRRVVARLEATAQGFDARYIVTTIAGSARHLYETVYCARGQAENPGSSPGLHKCQLASDRTSCRSPNANQFRLILHTAAYWLLHTLRAAAPKRSYWKTAEFTTLRLRLLKIAARVVEGTARIRVCLPTACPDAAIFRLLAGRFAAAGP
ncbi:MAG: transposase [Alphaproteobacteria bacterium]